MTSRSDIFVGNADTRTVHIGIRGVSGVDIVRNKTCNLLVRRQLLYRLGYPHTPRAAVMKPDEHNQLITVMTDQVLSILNGGVHMRKLVLVVVQQLSK